MAKIAVYHPIFGTGGGEAVAMNVLEALQSNHELELYTISKVDITYLNEYFNTSVSQSIPIREDTITKALKYSRKFWDAVSESGLGRLHASLFGQALRSQLSKFDLVVSTFGEFSFDVPTVQYVHYPMFNREKIPESIESRGGFRRVYDGLCDIASGNQYRSIDGILLANSKWTAGLTEQVHGIPVNTLYPPVDTAGFEPKPWSQRTEGFVTIGRIAPSKRVEDLITIVERLQNRGFDLPLHIVGPVQDEQYYEEIKSRIAGNELITLEGKVSRDRLIEFICSYKYGLHGMHHEHFGIVVAEFVAGGMIPFVHDSGGQREIVNQADELTYQNISDAVEKIEEVITNPEKQVEMLQRLPDVEERFGKRRFQREIRQIVDEAVKS